MDRTLKRSYARCRRLAGQHYENFPVVTWLVPASVRPHMHALYAFARIADESCSQNAFSLRNRCPLHFARRHSNKLYEIVIYNGYAAT